MKLAAMVPDRYIFAGREGVQPQAEARLVILGSAATIFERPTGVLRTSRPMDEMPDGIVFVLPEPPHPAGLAMLAPKLGIDMTMVQWGDEIIPVPRRSRGKLP